MISKNPNQDTGGKGGLTVGANDKELQTDLKMIQRALKDGWLSPWKVPQAVLESLPNIAVESLTKSREKGDERCVLRAVETLRAFQSDNMRLAEMVDKAERLDSNEATENTNVRILVEHIEQSGIIND